jgi:dTDP-4-amino-4,6-dideoxygalactose transaminase
VQLTKLPRFLERRQYLAARYHEALSSLPLICPSDPPAGEVHAWHLYVIRLASSDKVTRDELVQALSDRGIGTSVHYVPLHRQPYWRDRYALTTGMFPHSDAAYQSMVSIPLFTAMTDSDQDRVTAALREVLG